MTAIWRVRELRQRAGISQERLAELAGVARQTISSYENGKDTNWTTELVQRIAKALNVSIAELSGPGGGLEIVTQNNGSASRGALREQEMLMVPLFDTLEAWDDGKEPSRLYPVPADAVPNAKCVALRVDEPPHLWRGTVLPGDILILDPLRRAPRSREIVVCNIDGAIGLRRCRRDEDGIWLEIDGASPALRVPLHDAEILAVVAFAMRPGRNL